MGVSLRLRVTFPAVFRKACYESTNFLIKWPLDIIIIIAASERSERVATLIVTVFNFAE